MNNVEQAKNYGLKYINGLKLGWTDATHLSISTGQTRDSGNQIDMFVDTALALNSATLGLNGIDTGTVGNSKLYYVFLIGDLTQLKATGCIMSLSATPYLPQGYNLIKLIGYAFTNGSAQFKKFYTTGDSNSRENFWDTAIQVITTGTASTLTAADLSAAVPAVDSIPVSLRVDFTPATAGDAVSFFAFGSTATVGPSVSGVVATKIQKVSTLTQVSKLDTGVPKILYINSAAACNTDAFVTSFKYYV